MHRLDHAASETSSEEQSKQPLQPAAPHGDVSPELKEAMHLLSMLERGAGVKKD
jgi:hypothetical protein